MGRSLSVSFHSDVDGDLHLIADPSETDASDWRVFVIRHGQRIRVAATEFMPYFWTPPAGSVAWHVEYATEVEIEVGEDPVRVLRSPRFEIFRDKTPPETPPK